VLADDLLEADHGSKVKSARGRTVPGATLIKVLVQVVNVEAFLIGPVFFTDLLFLLRLLRGSLHLLLGLSLLGPLNFDGS